MVLSSIVEFGRLFDIDASSRDDIRFPDVVESIYTDERLAIAECRFEVSIDSFMNDMSPSNV